MVLPEASGKLSGITAWNDYKGLFKIDFHTLILRAPSRRITKLQHVLKPPNLSALIMNIETQFTPHIMMTFQTKQFTPHTLIMNNTLTSLNKQPIISFVDTPWLVSKWKLTSIIYTMRSRKSVGSLKSR